MDRKFHCGRYISLSSHLGNTFLGKDKKLASSKLLIMDL